MHEATDVGCIAAWGHNYKPCAWHFGYGLRAGIHMSNQYKVLKSSGSTSTATCMSIRSERRWGSEVWQAAGLVPVNMHSMQAWAGQATWRIQDTTQIQTPHHQSGKSCYCDDVVAAHSKKKEIRLLCKLQPATETDYMYPPNISFIAFLCVVLCLLASLLVPNTSKHKSKNEKKKKLVPLWQQWHMFGKIRHPSHHWQPMTEMMSHGDGRDVS